jgi:hypothetical protein
LYVFPRINDISPLFTPSIVYPPVPILPILNVFVIVISSKYNPDPESYNPVPEDHVVESDKSNAYSGFAPEDEVAETVGVKTLLTSPTTVDNNVHVVPSVDVATAVGEP